MMRRSTWLVLAIVFGSAMAAGKPLASVSGFKGKFEWVKLGAVVPERLKTLAGAKSLVIDLSFPKDVKLRKDANGNMWFTFILADQGSDWKWNQTHGFGAIPVVAGTVKAGRYLVAIPLEGIPASVLRDKRQTLSLGPGASGLKTPTSFSILSIRRK
jgi:hypothetical protein